MKEGEENYAGKGVQETPVDRKNPEREGVAKG